MLVLDTHAVIWWTLDPRRLSKPAAAAIAESDRLAIPSIVFWEVSLLVRRRKLALGPGVGEWAAAVCSIPRVEPLALTVEQAILADSLAMHPDPADRFIVAAAMTRGVALLTKDKLIRRLNFVKTIW